MRGIVRSKERKRVETKKGERLGREGGEKRKERRKKIRNDKRKESVESGALFIRVRHGK